MNSRRKFLMSATAGVAGLVGLYMTLRDEIIRSVFTLPDNRKFRNLRTPAISSEDVCILTTEATAGPYYIDNKILRHDIREDREGAALLLQIIIVDANTCRPISGAYSEIWQCDAIGYYSGYTDQDPDHGVDLSRVLRHGFKPLDEKTYLRGAQVTDGTGKIEFLTIYPGWYTPRVPHIHFKARLDDKEMITTQFYFPDEVTKNVHSTHSPYPTRSKGPYTNDNDIQIRLAKGAKGGWLKVETTGNKLVGRITLGVNRSISET